MCDIPGNFQIDHYLNNGSAGFSLSVGANRKDAKLNPPHSNVVTSNAIKALEASLTTSGGAAAS